MGDNRSLQACSQHGWRLAAKRVPDVLCAASGLVVMSPILAATALLIRLTMGKPVMFRQRRPGKHARPFTILKFRTMSAVKDQESRLLPDSERLTRIGRFLRSTSLDELPQLWNVLRGDISLVGPRPLLMEYLPRYSAEQARRHDVMPGITGWAQINGRNALTWEEKFSLDTWYVDNWSLKLDALILLKTLLSVMKREGISNGQHATVPEFMGNKVSVGCAAKD